MFSTNTILNKYKIEHELGKGKFGIVYKGINLKTHEYIAIKTESSYVDVKILKHEATILNHLYRNGCRCMPSVFWFGIYENYTCLIMNYYKCSLDSYMKSNEMNDIKINKMIAKMIEIVENIHSHYVVHRDIKPHNFMIGSDGELYLIDFGLATIYVDDNKKHIAEKKEKKEYIIGTPKYISYNIHDGCDPVRRDDLISIGYIYLIMKITIIPWDILHYMDDKSTNSSYDEMHVLNSKNQFRKNEKNWNKLSVLCSRIGDKIYNYMDYCYKLKFNNNPNYDGLKKLFI